jgi:methylmalonyl-CoA mutase N-terminal domain/subunit
VVLPVDPAMRLLGDLVEWCTTEMPRWHPVSISGYHIREAGSTASQELAFTLKDGLHLRPAGRRPRARRRRLRAAAELLLQRADRLLRGDRQVPRARRIWARELRDTFGAKDPRSLLMRFHTQTAGVSLTAQQPLNNIVRTAVEALAGVLGGTQSLHTNSYDEALALPSEQAVRVALRTQQVIAHETGVTNTIDPLGGSYFVEALTDELEAAAYGYFAKIDELGGMVEAVKRGYPQREIADAAFTLQQEIEAGREDPRRRQRLPRGRRRAARAPARRSGARAQADRPRAEGARRARRRRPWSARSPTCARRPPQDSVNLMPTCWPAPGRTRRRARSSSPCSSLRHLHRDAGL